MRLRQESLLRRLSPRRSEERGAILVMAAVGVVLSMIAGGLAIDLGRLAQTARENQKVADLAALDASRDVPTKFQQLAEESALRNGFPLGTAGYSLLAIEGTKVGGTCQSVAGAGSVCVTVTSPHKNAFPFVPGGDSVTRTAVAGAGNAIGRVRVGSSLASASGGIAAATQLKVFNKTISSLIGGNYSTDLVGWQGLASGTVTFAALTSELGKLPGKATFNTGTTTEVLDTTFTMGQLLTAMANVLNKNGTTTVGTNVENIGAKVDGAYLSQDLKLYDLFNVGSVVVGNKQDVANATLNVLDLIRGGAILANGSNLASFNFSAADVVGPVIPGGFSNVTVTMGLIEGPQTSLPGPAGIGGVPPKYYTSAETSQIRVRLDVSLRVPLLQDLTKTVLGVTTTVLAVGSLVDTTVSYYLNAGTAHAYLEEVNCGSSATPTSVKIKGVTETGSTKLGLVNNTGLSTESTTPVPVGDQPVATIPLIATVKTATTGLASQTIAGNGPAGEIKTFTAPYDGATSEHVSGDVFRLPSIADANLVVSPIVVGLNTGTLVSDLVSGINATGLTFNNATQGLTTSVIKPVYDALGLSFGTAHLWAPPVQTCAALSQLPVQTTDTPVLKG
jgi:uncharacterized membrane protein